MKKKNLKKTDNGKKVRRNLLKMICWGIVPAVVVFILVLDGLEVYVINDQRLIVLGIVLLVILLPFLSEITVKNVTIKRRDDT